MQSDPGGTKVDKLLLRIVEAAQVAGCSRSTGYDLVLKGEWQTVSTPYGRRVQADWLRAWIARQPTEGGR